MTNKPMLSVELRDLLERVASHDFAEDCQECGIGQSEVWKELRALLDKPVLESQYEGMTQVQAQAVSDGIYEILHGKPAIQQQGKPVAWLIQCQHSGLVEQAEPNDKSDRPEEWSDSFPVFRDPPEPVAVVMPERMDPRDPYDSEANQWNACLDEFARLNGVKP